MSPAEPAITLRSVGMPRRLAAVFYDLLLLVALWMLVTALFLPLNGGLALAHDSPLYDAYRITLASATLLFFTGFWSRGGQTLGMRAWHFKVVRDNGRPLRFSDALKRAAAALVSLAPAGLGFWWALFDPQSLAWHDRLSGTRLSRLA